MLAVPTAVPRKVGHTLRVLAVERLVDQHIMPAVQRHCQPSASFHASAALTSKHGRKQRTKVDSRGVDKVPVGVLECRSGLRWVAGHPMVLVVAAWRSRSGDSGGDARRVAAVLAWHLAGVAAEGAGAGSARVELGVVLLVARAARRVPVCGVGSPG